MLRWKDEMQILRKILNKIEPHFNNNGKLSNLYPIFEATDSFLFSSANKTQSGPHVRDSIDIKRVMFFVIISIPLLSFLLYLILNSFSFSISRSWLIYQEYFLLMGLNFLEIL